MAEGLIGSMLEEEDERLEVESLGTLAGAVMWRVGCQRLP
jgi:hypothetical protein